MGIPGPNVVRGAQFPSLKASQAKVGTLMDLTLDYEVLEAK